MARIHQGTSPNVILTLNIVKGKNLVPRARRGDLLVALPHVLASRLWLNVILTLNIVKGKNLEM